MPSIKITYGASAIEFDSPKFLLKEGTMDSAFFTLISHAFEHKFPGEILSYYETDDLFPPTLEEMVKRLEDSNGQ